MNRQNTHFLSVIIPAFKQEKTILRDLSRIEKTLSQIRYPYEIIVVVDGVLDKTFQKLRRHRSPNLKIYLLKKNHGKGYAVRYGLQKASGDYLAFLDAGMEIDPNGISMLIEHLEWYKADIIVGSKRHLASKVDYPLDRLILSWGYYWLVRLLFQFKIRDTQSGIKIFKRQVLSTVLPRLMVKQYAFDVELLAVAHRLGFTRIYEAPIKLKYHFGSVTNAATLKAIWYMLIDTLAVYYRLKILHYYDKARS
ncbi:MAG: glycosyltransferase family 2 protein [bacterium]